MEDIAAAASISRATVYLHFPGKPALLRALLEQDWEGQARLFDLLGTLDFSDQRAVGEWVLRVADGMRRARGSFGIHWAALGQNPELTLSHHRHRERLANVLMAARESRRPHEMTTTLEAELIVAELEHFATSAAVGWSEAQVAAALPIVVGRLRRFAASGTSETR